MVRCCGLAAFHRWVARGCGWALLVGVLTCSAVSAAQGGGGGGGSGGGGNAPAVAPPGAGRKKTRPPTPPPNPREVAFSALAKAVGENDLKAAMDLLAADPALATYVPVNLPRSILFSVRYNRSPEMLELLLSYGADPKQMPTWGFDLLSMIAFMNSYSYGSWAYLGDDGFNYKYENPDYGEEEGAAASETVPAPRPTWNPAAVELLLDHGANPDRLVTVQEIRSAAMVAAAAPAPDLYALFLRRGSDPQAVAPDGATLLHVAATGGSIATLQRLLELGLEINRPDHHGRTPLFYAAFGNRLAVVRWLLDHGADATVIDDRGRSVLHYLVWDFFNDNTARMALLQAHGARYLRDQDGRTPLFCFAGRTELVDRLERPGRHFMPPAETNHLLLFYYHYEQWLPGWLVLGLALLLYGGLWRALRSGTLAGGDGVPALPARWFGRDLRSAPAPVQAALTVRLHRQMLWAGWLWPALTAQGFLLIAAAADPLLLAQPRWVVLVVAVGLLLQGIGTMLVRTGRAVLFWNGAEMVFGMALLGAVANGFLATTYGLDWLDAGWAGVFGLGTAANLAAAVVAVRHWWNARKMQNLVRKQPKVDRRLEETGIEGRVEEEDRVATEGTKDT